LASRFAKELERCLQNNPELPKVFLDSRDAAPAKSSGPPENSQLQGFNSRSGATATRGRYNLTVTVFTSV
jgi:hypothetical protein